MRNRKIITLITLGVISVVIFVYGVISPRRNLRRGDMPPGIEHRMDKEIEIVVPVQREAERTKYVKWGRNPFVLGDVSESTAEFTLTGVMWNEEKPQAIINNVLVGVGQKVNGSAVVEIRRNSVILSNGIETFELKLAEEKGENL